MGFLMGPLSHSLLSILGPGGGLEGDLPRCYLKVASPPPPLPHEGEVPGPGAWGLRRLCTQWGLGQKVRDAFALGAPPWPLGD